MNPPAAKFRLGSEFDDFLFALIGEDRNGMPLSVISLLGRMDLDPWQEAASLAALPPENAAQRLASLLRSVPDPSLQQPDHAATATRLVALLPRRADAYTGLPETSAGSGGAARPQVIPNAVFLALYVILMLATQFTIGRLAPTHADPAHAPTSLTVPAHTPPIPSIQP
jgi:hypothetical protein